MPKLLIATISLLAFFSPLHPSAKAPDVYQWTSYRVMSCGKKPLGKWTKMDQPDLAVAVPRDACWIEIKAEVHEAHEEESDPETSAIVCVGYDASGPYYGNRAGQFISRTFGARNEELGKYPPCTDHHPR